MTPHTAQASQTPPPLDSWSLSRPLWLVEVHPKTVPDMTTLLQAEVWGGTYVLAFTTGEKARQVISTLGVQANAQLTCLPANAQMELVTAVCQVGATGIIVDLDPATRRCAWSRTCMISA